MRSLPIGTKASSVWGMVAITLLTGALILTQPSPADAASYQWSTWATIDDDNLSLGHWYWSKSRDMNAARVVCVDSRGCPTPMPMYAGVGTAYVKTTNGVATYYQGYESHSKARCRSDGHKSQYGNVITTVKYDIQCKANVRVPDWY